MKSMISVQEAIRRLSRAPRQTPEMFNRLRIVRGLRIRIVYRNLRIRIVYRNLHGRPCPW